MLLWSKLIFVAIYLKKKVWIFTYILNLFILQNGKVLPGFPLFCLVGFAFVRRLCRFFGRFAERVCGDGAFSWGFPCWEIGWNFCNFCILCSGCHFLLHFISLVIYYYYHYYFLVLLLIRHIRFCWFGLL